MDDMKLLEINLNMIETFVFECISELEDDEKFGHLASGAHSYLGRLEFEMWKRLTELRKASVKDT